MGVPILTLHLDVFPIDVVPVRTIVFLRFHDDLQIYALIKGIDVINRGTGIEKMFTSYIHYILAIHFTERLPLAK
jgi:hypothetical protein